MRRYALLVFLIVFSVAAGWLYLDSQKSEDAKGLQQSGTFVIKVRGIEKSNGRISILGKNVRISTFDTEAEIMPGDVIKVNGKISSVNTLENKSYGNYLMGRGFSYMMNANRFEIVSHEKNMDYVLYQIRSGLGDRIDWVFRNDSPLVKALIYGEREEITKEWKELFSKAGVSHIIAISGFHIGIIAAGVLLLLKKVPAKLRYGMAIGIILFFVLITGARPSALRAGVFYMILVAGIFLRREYDLISSGLMVASIFIAINPYILYDMGFSLSFLAVLSIGMFHPMLSKAIKNCDFFRKNVWTEAVLSGASLTLSAQILTLPLTYYYFGRVSVISLLTNLISVPLISMLYPVLFITLIVYELPLIGEGLQTVSVFGMKLFIGINERLAVLPFAYIDLPAQNMGWTLLLYGLILGFYLLYLKYELRENENHATGFEGID